MNDYPLNKNELDNTYPIKTIEADLLEILSKYKHKQYNPHVPIDNQEKALAALTQAINNELTRARESTRKIYDKELEMHRSFMSNVLARENLKTEKTMAICDACLKQLKQSQTEGGE